MCEGGDSSGGKSRRRAWPCADPAVLARRTPREWARSLSGAAWSSAKLKPTQGTACATSRQHLLFLLSHAVEGPASTACTANKCRRASAAPRLRQRETMRWSAVAEAVAREERGEHLAQDAPDRPHVHALGVLGASQQNFGCTIPTCCHIVRQHLLPPTCTPHVSNNQRLGGSTTRDKSQV